MNTSSRIIPHIQKALKHPKKAFTFSIWKIKEKFFWDHYYNSICAPKIKSKGPSINHEDIVKELKKNGFNVVDLKIDVNDYKRYIEKADYHKIQSFYGVAGKRNIFAEKTLQHYLAAKLLKLNNNDIYIDIANAYSPASEIYHNLYGCKVFSQDLIFKEGIHGNKIGGDASNMPVPDAFATSMGLHCSFEHFEQNADINFIKEAGRVLKPGGKMCILPLYLYKEYIILTDPTVLPKGGIPFESDAMLHCAKGYGNRHGRVYDIPHLITRIVNNLNDLKLTIYVVQNEKEVDSSCEVKFIALFKKV